jgi:hypothetical protein
MVGPPYPNPVPGAGPVYFDVQSPPGTVLTWDIFTTVLRKVGGGALAVSGNATINWNLTDRGGSPVANGLYYIRVKSVTGNATKVKILKVLICR